ncbi:MAG: chaperone NapD [Calditrichaeota bacterium]|nr:chaperone NapD [Calditrichota bacterium]
MPIAGIVVMTDEREIQTVYNRLSAHELITTYGIHQDNYIVAVIETDSLRQLEELIDSLRNSNEAILGIYPAYINFEDEVFDNSKPVIEDVQGNSPNTD